MISTEGSAITKRLRDGSLSLLCAMLLICSAIVVNYILGEEERRAVGTITVFFNIPVLVFGIVATSMAIRHFARTRADLRIALRVLPFTVLLLYLTISIGLVFLGT